MESGWFRQLFPKTRFHPRKNTEAEIMTTRQGFRLGTSVGGTLTGRGGDFIVIDDPMKPSEAASDAQRGQVAEWYDGTLYTRLDNKKEDVIILVMQRLHEDDLVAHVLEKDNWVHLNLPAIATTEQELRIDDEHVYVRAAGEFLHPEREDAGTLAQIKRNIGSFNFEAQYQQSPVPEEGNLIKREWFRRYSVSPGSLAFTEIVQSWDTAIETGEANDYSVCTTWGIREDCYYLIDVLRGRFKFPMLMRRVVSEAQKHTANAVIIEAVGGGRALIQSLQGQSQLNLIATNPKLDKVTRASQQSAQIEAGRVFLPQEAAWLAEFEREMLTFPKGRHDDQVDSMVQFLMWGARRHHQVPQVTCTLVGGGGSRLRDRYYERTGMSVF
jgi:predicted phage terminase large subunit-like protein